MTGQELRLARKAIFRVLRLDWYFIALASLIELAWNERQHGIIISWALTEAPDVEKELASEAAFRKSIQQQASQAFKRIDLEGMYRTWPLFLSRSDKGMGVKAHRYKEELSNKVLSLSLSFRER
ncbi:hypothetical protein VNO77_46335 [Canavalia gladiata]|uniref:Uncharacterized protein n=1 Tax=Canavalia gladiata TaxID=3824 RepID=A0AAN9JCG3_CANGL